MFISYSNMYHIILYSEEKNITLISLCILPTLCKYDSPLRVSLHIYAICSSVSGPVTVKIKQYFN